ncbi:MAG: hypothetical protein ITG02_03205 [Patulibacter sp.]|nr:hypothetical protein [Patulibacter sp.]
MRTLPWSRGLHGFPTSSWDWTPLLAALGPVRRDVTLDFLGFGASAKRHAHGYRHPSL